ncbi:unnamed protein product [Rhodiola kirilowii]
MFSVKPPNIFFSQVCYYFIQYGEQLWILIFFVQDYYSSQPSFIFYNP